MSDTKSEYVRAKEDFVTGHSGSTPEHIILYLAILLGAYLSWKWLALGLKPTQSIGFAKEFIVLIVPILVGCTMFDYSFGWMAGQLGFCWLFYRMGQPKKTKEVKPKPSDLKSPPLIYGPLIKSSISVFRAFLQYATICAILAVDFHIFPRSFAKTETFGVSLMDVGVGGYVFSSGLVAGPKLLSPNRHVSLWTAGKSTFFVFLIGFGRIILTKFLGYQEHVTEYGVHWNFFFTLGLIPFIVALQKKTVPVLRFEGAAFLILLCYTLALHFGGLEEYILEAPRTNWLNMNREGIFSFAGYYSLFLLAASLGNELLSSGRDSAKLEKSVLQRFGAYLLFSAVMLSVLVFGYDLQVSRRLANVSYVLWILCAALFLLLGIMWVDLNFPTPWVPRVFESLNRNQLALFLLANVMTGVINMSINTLSLTAVPSLIVLGLYMETVAYVAVKLRTARVLQLK